MPDSKPALTYWKPLPKVDHICPGQKPLPIVLALPPAFPCHLHLLFHQELELLAPIPTPQLPSFQTPPLTPIMPSQPHLLKGVPLQTPPPSCNSPKGSSLLCVQVPESQILLTPCTPLASTTSGLHRKLLTGVGAGFLRILGPHPLNLCKSPENSLTVSIWVSMTPRLYRGYLGHPYSRFFFLSFSFLYKKKYHNKDLVDPGRL